MKTQHSFIMDIRFIIIKKMIELFKMFKNEIIKSEKAENVLW